MLKLNQLLSNLKLSIQNKIIKFSCAETKLNLKFLNLMKDLGIIDGFSKCPIYKNKLIITLNFFGYFHLNLDQTKNFILNNIILNQREFILKILTKNKIYINVKKLIKLQKKNKNVFFILSTHKGFLTSKESIRLKIGGILICKIYN